eukprot:SAG11_NODE_15902_length_563_cov_0.879310_1_plen_143_part_00
MAEVEDEAEAEGEAAVGGAIQLSIVDQTEGCTEGDRLVMPEPELEPELGAAAGQMGRGRGTGFGVAGTETVAGGLRDVAGGKRRGRGRGRGLGGGAVRSNEGKSQLAPENKVGAFANVVDTLTKADKEPEPEREKGLIDRMR